MNFNWNDVIDGLDNGLDVVADVAAMIPGGQGVALAAKTLDNVVEKVNKKNQKNPLDTSLNIIKAVTESKNSNVGIDNDFVIDLLENVAKSSKNKIDDQLICLIKAYLQCKN